uniref:Uncharacterized protein n=1 Tax=Leersia perrieri TaxID=77586 RepID=A0A0D9VAG7_9ORYZ
MAAALRNAVRVRGRVLQAAAQPALKEEQRRLLPGLIPGGRMPLLRSLSSAGAQNIKGIDSWCEKHINAKPIANVEVSNKELRAQIEEKKQELFDLLCQLDSKSDTSGEKLILEDERLLMELPPFRELKELVHKEGIKLFMKQVGICCVLAAIISAV